MASYILTDDEITAILREADDYLELTVPYPRVAPVRTIPNAYKSRFYTLTRFEVPRGSIDGRDYVEVQTARTESTVDLISYRYKFNIPFVDVDSARRNGIPIWSDNVGVAMKQMNQQILHLIFEGTHSWDPVAINGLRDGGTEDANDAHVWNTATNPIDDHLATSHTNLVTAGLPPEGPYMWVLSSNLSTGLKKKYGAGDPSQELMTVPFGVAKSDIVYLPLGTSDRDQIYPIGGPDTDDGVWFLYKKDPQIFRLAQTGPPQIKIKSEMNMETMSFEGYIHWRGTMEIVQATGIRYDPDVDLA